MASLRLREGEGNEIDDDRRGPELTEGQWCARGDEQVSVAQMARDVEQRGALIGRRAVHVLDHEHQQPAVQDVRESEGAIGATGREGGQAERRLRAFEERTGDGGRLARRELVDEVARERGLADTRRSDDDDEAAPLPQGGHATSHRRAPEERRGRSGYGAERHDAIVVGARVGRPAPRNGGPRPAGVAAGPRPCAAVAGAVEATPKRAVGTHLAR